MGVGGRGEGEPGRRGQRGQSLACMSVGPSGGAEIGRNKGESGQVVFLEHLLCARPCAQLRTRQRGEVELEH